MSRRAERYLRRNRQTLALSLESLEERRVLATWTPLPSTAQTSLGTMLLQTDGSVLAQGPNESNNWFKLTPDSQGSYVNGAWSPAASMANTRLYYSSNVLPDSRTMVLGGSLSSAGYSTKTGELYDSRSNVWTAMANFPEIQYGSGQTILLPSGKILAGSLITSNCYLYDPSNNTWTVTGSRLHNERNIGSSWTLLPDGDVLSYDILASYNTGLPQAQRFDLATGTWVEAGTLPVLLTSPSAGFKLGPALRLHDGRILQLGANSNTALYDPTTNTWTAGPMMPGGRGADSSPAAIMPNGRVIFTADTPLSTAPTRMLEFDPVANTISDITSSLPSDLQTNLNRLQAYRGRMLMLPTGEVLFSPDFSAPATAYIYSADGTAPESLRPSISSVTRTTANGYTLTGQQLTGQSAGAAFGAGAHMDSNYPIVQLTSTDGSNSITYARTFNWTPGVATGNATVSTQFELPASLPAGLYNLRVIAGGLASAPVPFTAPASLAVLASSPASGATINSAPTSFPVTFNEAIEASSLQASDLTVNGIAADSVTLDASGKVSTFNFTTSPVTSQGMQSLAIQANAITGINGQGNWAYSTPFRYDSIMLAVVSTVPSVTGIFAVPATSWSYDVTFSEPIDPTKVSPNNLTLSQGVVTSAVALPGNTTVRYTLSGLRPYNLSVYISAGRLTDQFGNPDFRAFSMAYTVNTTTSVTSTSPAVDSSVVTPPNTFSINFDRSITPASLQANDLVVNGIAASLVALAAPNSALFYFPNSPVSVQGVQTMSLAAGAVTGTDGSPLAAFNASFRFDPPPLLVTSAVPTAGNAIPLSGPLTFDVTFNRAIDVTSVSLTDFVLSGMPGVYPSGVQVLPGNQTVRVSVFDVSTEGVILLNMPAGAIRDSLGNPSLVAFTTTLAVEAGARSFAGAFNSVAPAGSMVYEGQLIDTIHFASDNDVHTLMLDPGQTLTVSVVPGSATLQPQVDVLDSTGAVLGNSAATSAGATALLQTLAIAGGSYSIRVRSVGGTVGPYTLRATLNAAMELESTGGAANDSIASAQSIDGSMLILDSESRSRRGVVLGGNLAGSWSDVYSFTATSADAISVALKNQSGNIASVQLQDAGGAVLSSAVSLGSNFDLGILNFVVPTSGTYYLQVAGTSDSTYSLTTLVNAVFNVETDSVATASLLGAGSALGHLGLSTAADQSDWYAITLQPGQTTLNLFTSTPGDAAGEFNNTLNSNIKLYDSLGTTLIARSHPLSDGRNEELNAVGLTAGTTYKIQVAREGDGRGEYVLHRQASVDAPLDIVIGQFTAVGGATLSLTYQINNRDATPFRIGFYNSSDPTYEPGLDGFLSAYSVSSAGDLTVGPHTLAIPLGTAAGQVALPGAGLAMPATEFYLLAVVDDTWTTTESTVNNNASRFSGVYHITRGDVVVMGTDGDNTITVTATTQLRLTFDGLTVTYPLTDPIAFDYLPYAGNDRIDGAGVARAMNFYASSGTDVFGGGVSGSTVIGPAVDNSWVLTAPNAGRIGDTTFSRIGNLTGGPLSDNFAIVLGATLSGTIQGSTGRNTLDYSAFTTAVNVNLQSQTATALSRPFVGINRVRGGSGVNVLTSNNFANEWTIDGINSGTLNLGQASEVVFAGFPVLNGGSSIDRFNFKPSGSVSRVDGKAGNDWLVYSQYASAATVNLQNKTATGLTSTWAGIESAIGSDGASTVIGPNATTLWDVVGPNMGNAGSFFFQAFPNLIGGTATDTFAFRNSGSVYGSIDGKSGINALDYSGALTRVVVNLQTAKATSVGGSIANIRNITGSSYDDILIGDALANAISGGGGRNLIIGRNGVDTLIGGSEGDILIGGRTAYDANDLALITLMQIWTDRNRSYQERINALQTGVNYIEAGTTKRASLTSTNVFDDQAVDTLNGGAGVDWYFARLTGTTKDTVNNRAVDEVLSSI